MGALERGCGTPDSDKETPSERPVSASPRESPPSMFPTPGPEAASAAPGRVRRRRPKTLPSTSVPPCSYWGNMLGRDACLVDPVTCSLRVCGGSCGQPDLASARSQWAGRR